MCTSMAHTHLVVGFAVTVRPIDSLFAITADSINDIIQMSMCVSDFFVVCLCLFPLHMD